MRGVEENVRNCIGKDVLWLFGSLYLYCVPNTSYLQSQRQYHDYFRDKLQGHSTCIFKRCFSYKTHVPKKIRKNKRLKQQYLADKLSSSMISSSTVSIHSKEFDLLNLGEKVLQI